MKPTIMRTPFDRTHLLGLGMLCLLLSTAACSSGRETTREEPAPRPPAEEPVVEEPGEDPAPVARTVQGFRIQIHATPEKGEADAAVAEALDWWGTVPQSRRPGRLDTAELPLYVRYKQPYYRVRVGDFATRGEAEQALALLSQRYPGAVIVPDTVTIRY